jgi:disulfide bond formation protein DsbB
MKLLETYQNQPMRFIVLASSAASAAMLSAALIAQYGFELFPCELCLFQRVPYGIIALFGLAAGMYMPERRLKLAAVLCGLLFLVDAGIAGYHTGVEYGIFKGPSACASNSEPGATLEEMRRAIMNAQLVPCDQPMASFLGLSMAAWNTLAATTLAMGVFYLMDRVRRRPIPFDVGEGQY